MHYPFSYFPYVQNQSFTWSWYCSSPTDNWRRYRCTPLCTFVQSRGRQPVSTRSYLPLTCHLTAQTDDWWVQQWQQKPLASAEECRSPATAAAVAQSWVRADTAAVFGQRPKVSCCAASGLWPCTRYCLVFGAITHPSCSRLSSSLAPKSTAHCFTNLESLFDMETIPTCLNSFREYYYCILVCQ